MNLITCSSNCVYQENGECKLERAASMGQSSDDGCAYFVRRASAGGDSHTTI